MIGVDLSLCAAAYYAAYIIRFDGAFLWGDLDALRKTIVFILLIKLLVLLAFKAYSGIWRYTSVRDLLQLLKALAVGSIAAVSFVLWLYRFEGFSRGVFVIDFLLSVGLLGGSRLAVRLVATHWTAAREDLDGSEAPLKPMRRVIIKGAGNAGEKLAREIEEIRRLSYEVVGFVDDDVSKIGRTIHGVKVLGSLQDLKQIVSEFDVDETIIAVPSASATQMRRIVDLCKETNLPFKTVPGMGELIEGRVSVNALREVRYEDLLGRKPVDINVDEIGQYLEGKSVMVTGAAGSIGSELCRQITAFKPSLLVLLDRNESGLYDVEMEFRTKNPGQPIVVALGAVQNKSFMKRFISLNGVQVVFHAAAYKHVPMMELHPWEAVFNNVLGTKQLLDLCIESGIRKCVVISSDKAVRPTNVMGAAKRLTELLAQAYAKKNHCKFMAVRFGNVIGSVGSVVPLFRKQIEQGGPVTVTHREITRYFMTIPEACRLVLQAGAIGRGGEIFVLKMGTPVRIDTLAREMIALSGLRPNEDIQIEYTGLRPGEKLYEELIAEGEEVVPTTHEKIMVLRSRKAVDLPRLNREISQLVQLAAECSAIGIRAQLQRMVAGYIPDTGEGRHAGVIFPAATELGGRR
jgi:FlaA1/EpsC-like NDP-sugar epimerase